MNTKHKFCRGDYCVLKSPKSSNNGKVVEVIEYPMKKCSDIVRVRYRSQELQYRESSLQKADKYDVIRSLSNKQLKKLLHSLQR